MKITVLDGYAANHYDISWDKMASLGKLTVYERTAPNDIYARIKDSDAVLTNKCPITRELMEKLPRLKYIGVLATGYNIVDTAAAKDLGIAVTNIPAYSTMSVAQQVFALILEIASHVGEHSRSVHAGKWTASPDFCFWDYPLIEISGKTLGIIGYGAIGKAVGRIAEAFNMKVIPYSPSIAGKDVLEKIYAESDIISLNCPQKPDNLKMINSSVLAAMKPGAWLINTARGGLIDEDAVAEALKSGKLGWYAADVVSKEPMAADNPLLDAPHTIFTPHIAWAPYEARVRLMDIACENLSSFINGASVNRVENK